MSLVTDVQQLVDESGGAVWWTAQQVYDAINEALLEDWAILKPQAGTATLTITAGSDILAFDRTTIMLPQYFIYPSLNVKIFPTIHDELENWSRRWRGQSQARPQWAVLWDANHFRFWPQADATYQYVLWGVPWPPEIGTATQDASLEIFQRKAVVLRAAASLLDLTQPDLADAYRGEADQHAKRAIEEVRQQFDANVDRIRPGTGWSIAQFGRISLGRQYR